MKPIYSVLLSLAIFATSVLEAKTAQPAAIKNPSYNASTLVKMAYKNVPKNYSTEASLMNAFYRESINKDNSCVLISEAILDINKASYLTARNDMVVIRKARSNKLLLNGFDSIMVKFQGGPNSALLVDVVKYPFLGADINEIDDKYKFSYDSPVIIDGVTYYVVKFDEKFSCQDILFRGILYIEPKSLAIGRVEFSMNVEKRGDAYQIFVKRKPALMKMDVKHANYVVNYKQYNNKWYFDYSTSEVKFHARWNKKSVNNDYTLKSQLAVINMITDKVKLDKRDLLKPTDIVSEKVKDYNDSTNWDVYNLIMLLALLSV
ncbi:MAG: hypothetical protein ABFC28_06820 [Rikenellaceae bacterium]